MYSVKLAWKQFNVDLPSIEAWVKNLAGSSYKGNSADSALTLWFEGEDPAAIPMHDVQVTIEDPAVDAVAASASVQGVTLTAMTPGAAGNVTLHADSTSTIQELVDAHNAANPDNEILAEGFATQILAADVILAGGTDEIPAGSHQETQSQPSGDPSLAEQIQAYWDSIQSNSAEAVAYTQKAQLAAVKKQVEGIAAFSADLLNQFAAENIAMGITQDNKTEDVLDVMLPVMNALQGGAPTIAIKRAKAIPESSYDSKYVTAARLLAYVNKIEAFLGLPQSSSLS